MTSKTPTPPCSPADLPPETQQTFCPAPFSQMLLHTTGKAYPCCYHFGYSLGDLRHRSLEEVWNGARMQRLRREFLTGEVRTCRARMKHIGCHKRWQEHYWDSVDASAQQPHPPRRLDVRLGGRCNLKCVMCEVWKQPNRVYDETDFWTRGPTDIFPYTEEIDVLGGEPFVQKDTYRLLREVTAVNPGCRFGFVTNAHYPFTKRVRDALDPVVLRFVQVSLDSLNPETYARIRRGGELEQALTTLGAWRDYREKRRSAGRGFEMSVSMCVLRENWEEVPAFLEFCADRGVEPELQYAHYDPSRASSLDHMGMAEKEHVLTTLEARVPRREHHRLRPVLSPLKQAVNAHPPGPPSTNA